MTKVKTITSALLATLLIAGSSLPVKAEGDDTSSVTKSESVYTVLNADGSVKKITVSDTLHSDSGFSNYTDASDLTDVENLKSTDAVTSTNGGYTWTSDSTDIYYQGTSTKDLPLNVKITYTLNDKEYSAEDMIGKSGHVKIKISVENTSKQTFTVGDKSYDLVTPFITGAGAMLDEDNFSNVEVNHGTVTSDSSHSIVAGVMIPGLRDGLESVLDGDTMSKLSDYLIDDITIEADTTDFECPTLMLAAATSTDALKEDFEDTDLTSIFDQLDELKDATDQLISGSKTLYEGANTLNDGVSTLQDGANKLSSGASSLYDGANSLYAGATTLYNGLSSISSQSSSLNSGMQTLADTILATVNESLTAQGLEAVTWDNYSTQLKKYMDGVTDEEIASAKAQINEKAGNVDDSTVNTLIYMAAINTASDVSFEDKVTAAGATLTEANTIQNSDSFVEAQKIVGLIQNNQFDFDNSNAKVTQVLNAIKEQSLTNYSQSNLDDTFTSIVSTIKKSLSDKGCELTDDQVKVILAYACDNPVSEEVLGENNICNALQKVNFGEKFTGASDPRNDVAVVNVLKATYTDTVSGYTLKQIYEKVITDLTPIAGDNAALVFAYGVTKHFNYDASKYTPTTFFTEYSGDLTKLLEASNYIELANSAEGLTLINGVLTQIVAKTLNESLEPAIEQLNGVNTLVQGIKAYTAGVDKCYSGAESLKNGAATLADGTKTLKDGTDSLTNGIGTLKDGSSQLADGAKTLYDGLLQYNDEAISKLTDDSRISNLEDAADLLNAVKEQGSSYNNYSGISDGTDGSVKFVYKVEGAKATTTTTTTDETTETKTSFWDRIVKLFDFSSLFASK